jgi:hypothetical protein
MSSGQDLPDFFRRAVAYTDKILEGANPADLPVEQPTKPGLGIIEPCLPPQRSRLSGCAGKS